MAVFVMLWVDLSLIVGVAVGDEFGLNMVIHQI